MEENKNKPDPKRYEINWSAPVKVEITIREIILSTLEYIAKKEGTSEEERLKIKENHSFLSTHLGEVTVILNESISGVDVNFKYNGGDEIRDRISEYFKSDPHIRKLLELFLIDIKERQKENETLKKQKRPSKGTRVKRDDRLTRMSIHALSQFYGDSKQLSIFSDEVINDFSRNTGLTLTNKPLEYGAVLNQTQRKVFEGILKAFSDSNYKGDEELNREASLREVYSDTQTSAETLVKKENAPYKNINKIPVVRLTQAQIIELSGYDLKRQRQGDKVDVIEAISFLATKQFCFYWVRLKTEKGKPVKDKKGDYIKEEVMEVGTLLRIKTVRDKETGEFKYYEIHPSAPVLDQVNSYFLLIPATWREEVKQLTGKRASSYTYEFLFWLRLQYEQIRRYNSNKGRKPKPFIIKKSWEDVAIAIKMPESMYISNRKRSVKIIQDAYSIAIKLGYLIKVENDGATDILYLNEIYYPKPGKLV